MASEAQRAACKRYYQKTKSRMRTYVFKVDRAKEPMVVEWLDSQRNTSEAIRNALRREFERSGNADG